MNIKGKTKLAIDIETEGLFPANGHELISFAIGNFGMIQNEDNLEKDILLGLSSIVRALPKETTTFISFMGGTTYSKMNFDFSFLRTRYVINKMTELYPFTGCGHIDIFPVIQSQFILEYEDVGKINDMDAPGVSKMARDMNIKPESTKGANVIAIEKLVPENQIKAYLESKGIMKKKSHNSLKEASMLLLKIPDDGMRGKDVPPLFAQWKENQDPEIIAKILKYNIADCRKTWLLYEEIKEIVTKQSMRVDIL